MMKQTPQLTFTAVDLGRDHELCVEFRRETHRVSYGNLDHFSREETLAWFEALAANPDAGFLHVRDAGEIIGQLEYQCPRTDAEGQRYGYINLIYLVPAYRHRHLGGRLQAYMLDQFQAQGCTQARLRYLPHNTAAGAFYRRQGWQPVGVVQPNGQLMEKSLAGRFRARE